MSGNLKRKNKEKTSSRNKKKCELEELESIDELASLFEPDTNTNRRAVKNLSDKISNKSSTKNSKQPSTPKKNQKTKSNAPTVNLKMSNDQTKKVDPKPQNDNKKTSSQAKSNDKGEKEKQNKMNDLGKFDKFPSNNILFDVDATLLKTQSLEIATVNDRVSRLEGALSDSRNWMENKLDNVDTRQTQIIDLLTKMSANLPSVESPPSNRPSISKTSLYPNSSTLIEQKTFDLAINSLSANTFALIILPPICKVSDVYRVSLSGSSARVPEERKHLYLKTRKFDPTIRDEINLASKIHKPDTYSKSSLSTALTNYFKKLNNFFLSLKADEPFTPALIKQHELTIPHIKFSDLPAYLKDRTLFNKLDDEFDNSDLKDFSKKIMDGEFGEVNGSKKDVPSEDHKVKKNEENSEENFANETDNTSLILTDFSDAESE